MERSFSRNKLALQSKKYSNCIKYREKNCRLCGHNNVPSPGNRVFLQQQCVFNGSVFARGVWGCFPIQDHEERWRASINSSSYQWPEEIRAALCPCVSAWCRWYRFPPCCALLCRQHLPFTPPPRLSLWLRCCSHCRTAQLRGYSVLV